MDLIPICRSAVGMDVHLNMIEVCAIVGDASGEAQVHRRRFGGFRRDRLEMAQWIAGFAPETVVMESTGIFWKSPYAYLERLGIRALVVNAQHVKTVPGRKTDVGDAEWLAMLARAGLLRGSFIPPEPLRNLRQLSRHHQRVTAMLAAEKNRAKPVVTRFKGLGEMSPLQLRETTMDPATRRLVQLTVSAADGADQIMDMLLAKKRSGDRRDWLEEKGNLAEVVG